MYVSILPPLTAAAAAVKVRIEVVVRIADTAIAVRKCIKVATDGITCYATDVLTVKGSALTK